MCVVGSCSIGSIIRFQERYNSIHAAGVMPVVVVDQDGWPMAINPDARINWELLTVRFPCLATGLWFGSVVYCVAWENK